MIIHSTDSSPKWVSVTGIPGWEQFEVGDLSAGMVDGQPVLLSVSLKPKPGSSTPLTPALLAGLPTRNIAALVLAFEAGDALGAAAAALSDEPLARPTGGSDEFSREVVETVRQARLRAEPGVQAVADRYYVSSDRAAQYIREARQRLGRDVLPDGRSERHQRPEQRRYRVATTTEESK